MLSRCQGGVGARQRDWTADAKESVAGCTGETGDSPSESHRILQRDSPRFAGLSRDRVASVNLPTEWAWPASYRLSGRGKITGMSGPPSAGTQARPDCRTGGGCPTGQSGGGDEGIGIGGIGYVPSGMISLSSLRQGYHPRRPLRRPLCCHHSRHSAGPKVRFGCRGRASLCIWNRVRATRLIH